MYGSFWYNVGKKKLCNNVNDNDNDRDSPYILWFKGANYA